MFWVLGFHEGQEPPHPAPDSHQGSSVGHVPPTTQHTPTPAWSHTRTYTCSCTHTCTHSTCPHLHSQACTDMPMLFSVHMYTRTAQLIPTCLPQARTVACSPCLLLPASMRLPRASGLAHLKLPLGPPGQLRLRLPLPTRTGLGLPQGTGQLQSELWQPSSDSHPCHAPPCKAPSLPRHLWPGPPPTPRVPHPRGGLVLPTMLCVTRATCTSSCLGAWAPWNCRSQRKGYLFWICTKLLWVTAAGHQASAKHTVCQGCLRPSLPQ